MCVSSINNLRWLFDPRLFWFTQSVLGQENELQINPKASTGECICLIGKEPTKYRLKCFSKTEEVTCMSDKMFLPLKTQHPDEQN